MEVQIQDLITSIKKDGIDAANAEAQRIIEEATKKSEEIVAKAKEEAKQIATAEEKRISTIKAGAFENIEQAKRDAVLSFKKSIEEEFEALLKADIKKAVNKDTLGSLIKACLADEDPGKYVAQVTEITDGLKAELAKEIKAGLEIKVTKEVKGGFKLSAKDDSGFFDLTNEEIAEMLKPFFTQVKF